MAVLAPLSTAPADSRLTTWRAAPLRWWLLSADSTSTADLGRAIEHLIQRAAPATSWLASVEGGSEEVRYAVEVSGEALRPLASAGRRRGAAGRLDRGEAQGLLDAAQSVALDVLLVGVDEAADLATPLGPCPPGTAERARLAVLWPAGAAWIAVGAAGGAPPPLPATAMVEPMAPPHGCTRAAPRLRSSPRRLLALSAALAVAAAGATVAAWVTPRSGSPGSGAVTPAGGASLLQGGTVASTELPMPRQPPSIVYDAAHGQALLFGGLGQVGPTWLWRNGAWTARQTRGSPPDSTGAAAAYDPQAQRVLIFGGRRRDGSTPGDTWAWNGTSWSRLAGAGAAPPGAPGAGMAYDEAAGAMVLVTAGASPGVLGETWTFDGARWIRQSAGDLPVGPSRVIAFDPQTRGVLLVTTGSVPGGPARTWSWDGTGRWRELHPASEPPGGGSGFVTVDPLSGRLLLVTPPSGQAVIPLQTWAWNGRTWSDLQPTTSPRFAVGLVTERQDGVAISFGFSRPGIPGTIDAAWAWTGTTWVQLAAAPDPRITVSIAAPPARSQAWLAYNPADDRLVLFGGLGEVGEQLHDTWLWDGSSWTEAPGADGPPAGGPMAFDPVTRTIVLVTDGVGPRALPQLQTWSWNGATWRRLSPAREIPSSLSVVALEQDPAAGQMVAIALCCVGPDGRPGSGAHLQTWTWNGSTWTPAHPSTELTGGGQLEMAYDTAARRVIAIVGGAPGQPTATWAWDGSSWTRLAATAPAAGDSPTVTMAADPSTGSIVIFQTALPASDTLSQRQLMAVWTGDTWTTVSSAEPSPQVDTTTHATQPFFEPHIGRLIVLGSPEHDFSRVWMWTGRSWLELDAPHL